MYKPSQYVYGKTRWSYTLQKRSYKNITPWTFFISFRKACRLASSAPLLEDAMLWMSFSITTFPVVLCMWYCSILLLGLNFKRFQFHFFVHCRDVFGETGGWKLPLKPHGYVPGRCSLFPEFHHLYNELYDIGHFIWNVLKQYVYLV